MTGDDYRLFAFAQAVYIYATRRHHCFAGTGRLLFFINKRLYFSAVCSCICRCLGSAVRCSSSILYAVCRAADQKVQFACHRWLVNGNWGKRNELYSSSLGSVKLITNNLRIYFICHYFWHDACFLVLCRKPAKSFT